MPELPEVETVRRGLAPALVGRRIVKAETRRGDLRFPFPKRFAARLTGRRVDTLERRAKYLLAYLDDGNVWTTHLGMTGRWSVIGAKKQPGDFYYAEPPDPTHTHVVLQTDKGVRLEFNDPRRFGYMDLIRADELDAHPWFKGLGPEPLGNQFHIAHLKSAFAGKKTSVKAALLDQRVVAGLGNIYVVEALYRAHIAPQREAGRLSSVRRERLFHAIRAVLEEAIEAGGSTLSDYAAVDGAEGGFQHRFRVYDREGQACMTPDCPGTIRRVVQGGRSTFWCPRCQR
ncbi:MAG TPA: bifunctional DNA-formamidopyrimidine glycosylase/DNA-(apurinic or apyrimidinic site) lyase [Caulobacterales bacterium]|nr:bifunctional DNA-formamidopyrimidine glycosylase/DNA-(apurinic or apyrimidinic site) lyase [Caulobacterales bacterium]